MPLSDAELVERAKKGDIGAFEDIVRRYEGKVFGCGMRMMGNAADAQEALQDVFLSVYQKIRNFRGESAFSSWLYRIAVNACLMRLRTDKRHTSVSLDGLEGTFTGDGRRASPVLDWSQEPEERFLSRETREHLNKAILSLPEEYRSVLVLRDVQELPISEVAEVTNLSIPAVKSRLHRGRLFLREKLSEYFGGKR